MAQMVKNLPTKQRIWVQGLGRSPEEGNSYPLQDSCLENPMDTGAWWATVHRAEICQTRLRLTLALFTSIIISCPWASQVENPPANAGDARDTDSIPGWETAPGEGNGNPLQYTSLGNPWTGEPGRLQSVWSERVGHNWACTHTHTHTYTHTHTHAHTSAFLCKCQETLDLQVEQHDWMGLA